MTKKLALTAMVIPSNTGFKKIAKHSTEIDFEAHGVFCRLPQQDKLKEINLYSCELQLVYYLQRNIISFIWIIHDRKENRQ